MTPEIIVTALVEAVRKRRILGLVPSARLGDVARQKAFQNLDEVRKWLDMGDGLSTPLANQIRNLLPKKDEIPYGPYIPLSHLADGGMGTVWLACSPENKLVVVKTLKSNLTAQPGSTTATEFMRRFEREAKITMQLNHPSVVRCLDHGVRQDGTAFMVLEYVDSGDLKDLVDSRAGLKEGLALAIIYQVVDALCEAHRVRLVHRDIKPANIFVSSDGRAKLADFGIARSTEQNRTMLTMEGAIVGSPLYMSPEQILTDPNLDIRSDIYAMGAVLFYTLAARAPYDGKVQEVLHKHCTATIPDVRTLRPQVSERSHQIILGCMQKERDKRYKDPGNLLADLADALVRLGLNPGGPIEDDTRPGDLSDPEAGFKPDQATIASNLNEATMAADLSGGNGQTMATQIREPMTIVANLLAESSIPGEGSANPTEDAGGNDLIGATLARPATSDATAVTMAGVGVPGTALEGDFATALAEEWITLRSNTAGDPTQVMLFAKSKIILGKLREAPVDLCVRNYPVMQHKDQCQRVSRQHVAIAFDAIHGLGIIEDLGAANGTMLDGIQMKAQSSPLESGRDNILVLAGVVALWVKPRKRAGPVIRELPGAPKVDGQPQIGLEVPNTLDAIVVTRPENRPELSYAMVMRRLTIGGPGAELACAGSRTHAAVEVARYGGRWLWRPAGEVNPWHPLAAGVELDIGGRKLIATPGDYSHFD